ncbi:MAG: amino acid adenylation domain-containing protein [Flavobacteriaceae bacterium]
MIYTLPHIIENSARLFPKKEAFRCGNDSLSYSDLELKTNQLAKYLVNAGVQKGDRVGIYMNRCLETAVAVYGIMKSGAAYVPLDPQAPHTRTLFLLEDCGIKFLVSTAKQSKRIVMLLKKSSPLRYIIGLSGELPITTISWDAIYRISMENYKAVKILGQDMAYIMYTSGSTGVPKGIMHTHNSGLNYAKLSVNLYGLYREDRVGNHAPLHFDISTFGYFSAPLAGATTIIVPDAYTKLPASLAELMEKEKLTIWYSVPLALIQLWLSGVLKKNGLYSLRWVLFGGENFTVKYLRALMQYWPHAKFSNVYGPAEVNQCTYHHLQELPDLEDQIPIGQVWDNTEYKILNKNDEQVPPGTIGELVVRTCTMMKGYWNNKDLTEKSLYRETIGPQLEFVYYRTGDLVNQNQKGALVFMGRNDRQVKIRGYRVEIDEVEAILTRHEKVKEAAVYVIEKENNNRELSAAVLLMPKSKAKPQELVSFCKLLLPSYAIPNKIDILDNFSRTSSGKIDRESIKNSLIEL